MGTTKADIIDTVHAKLPGFTKKETASIVDATLEVMKGTLASGETVKVSGFGNFVVKQKGERAGRNPKTGEVISISPRRVLTFKVSQVLRAALNEGGQ